MFKLTKRVSVLIVMTAAIASSATIVACKQLGSLGDALAPFTPKLRFKEMSLKSLSFSAIDVDFLFALDNPNPVSVKLASFGYALGLQGVEILKGTQNDGLKLEARGESELAIPLSLTYARIFELVAASKGKDNLDYSIGGQLGFNTPVGVAHVPFQHRGAFPVLHAPDFSIKGISLGDFSPLQGKARLDLKLGVANPSGGSAVGFQNLRYNISLMGSPIVESVLAAVPDVASGASSEVVIPIVVNLLTAGATIADSITNKKPLDLGFQGIVDVRTPFGVIPFDIKEVGNFLLK